MTNEDHCCLPVGVVDLRVEGVEQSNWFDHNVDNVEVFWVGLESCAG